MAPQADPTAWQRLRLGWRSGVDMLLRGWGRATRLLRYAAVWVLLMVASAWMPDELRLMDWALVDRLAPTATPWPSNVELVDLGWDLDPAKLKDFRENLAAAMTALARLERKPRMVVIDVAVSPIPLGLGPLQKAAKELVDQRIEIVGVADRSAFAPGLGKDDALERQGFGPDIYNYEARLGHSSLRYEGNSYWYWPCLEVGNPVLSDYCLPAVPYIVGEKVRRPDRAVPAISAEARPVLFQPGSPELWPSRVWKLDPKEGLVSADGRRGVEALAHSIVILGNPAMDVVNGRPGPELLAWAIGATASPTPPEAPRPTVLATPGWTLGFALAFSAFAVAVFKGMQRALKHPERHLVGLTVASALVSLCGLAALLVLMRQGMHVAFVPVSYVVVAILVTIGMAWRELRNRLRDLALTTDVDRPPGTKDEAWDVFVSYSHSPAENIDWVERNLVLPLRARGLNVFFDKHSLKLGTDWYFKIAYGIQSSRCMVAVYSEDYFQKSFCRFELRKATVRHIAADRGKGNGSRSFSLLPFQSGRLVAVPFEFDHVQYEMFTNADDAVNKVLEALRAQPAAPPRA